MDRLYSGDPSNERYLDDWTICAEARSTFLFFQGRPKVARDAAQKGIDTLAPLVNDSRVPARMSQNLSLLYYDVGRAYPDGSDQQ